MNYNMDVVHELGRYGTNLNIFNVAVTDAKQVAHQVSATIHHTRKGYVYEGTSACIMAASRFILGNLRPLADKCKAGHVDLFDRFGLQDEMLQSTITYKHADKIIQLTKGPPITSAFPIVQLSKDLFYKCNEGTQYIVAVTDGDASMWQRFQKCLPSSKFDPSFQYCDWHKGEVMKKEGDKLIKLALSERTRLGSAYDRKWKLGHLLQNKQGQDHNFTSLFGRLLHVVRRHDSEPVADLFWTLFMDKARESGVCNDSFEMLHHYKTGTSGRYGMSTFLKFGCGLTANSLEARANKNVKRALGTKLGLLPIISIVKQSCSSQVTIHKPSL